MLIITSDNKGLHKIQSILMSLWDKAISLDEIFLKIAIKTLQLLDYITWTNVMIISNYLYFIHNHFKRIEPCLWQTEKNYNCKIKRINKVKKLCPQACNMLIITW